MSKVELVNPFDGVELRSGLTMSKVELVNPFDGVELRSGLTMSKVELVNELSILQFLISKYTIGAIF